MYENGWCGPTTASTTGWIATKSSERNHGRRGVGPLATVLAFQETHEDEVGTNLTPRAPSATKCWPWKSRFHGDASRLASNWCLDRGSDCVDSHPFTPNQDQTNDRSPGLPDRPKSAFGRPQGDNPNFKMDIVSRWAPPSVAVHRRPWNGRVGGRMVKEGRYIAHIQYLTARVLEKPNCPLDGPSRKVISCSQAV